MTVIYFLLIVSAISGLTQFVLVVGDLSKKGDILWGYIEITAFYHTVSFCNAIWRVVVLFESIRVYRVYDHKKEIPISGFVQVIKKHKRRITYINDDY